MRPKTIRRKWLRAPLIALGATAMLLGATATAEAQGGISGIASQASVDVIDDKLDARLDVTVSSRATQTSVDAVQTSVDALDTSNLDVTVSSRATQTSVDALESQLDAAAATTFIINENFSALVEKVIAMKKVDLEVIVIKDEDRFLLIASEAGVPVDVELVSVKVAKVNNGPLTFVDVTGDAIATVVGSDTGILDVSLDKNANLFQFTVLHDDGTDLVLGLTEHFGIATVFRKIKKDDDD